MVKGDNMEPEADPAFDLPPNLEDVLAGARSPRARIRRGLITVALIVVTLAAVLIVSARVGVAGPLIGVKATLQLASNADWTSFVVTTGGSHTTIHDGQHVRIPLGTTLQPNRVLITAAATPFAPVSCQVTFPLSDVDTCPITVTGSQQYAIGIKFTLDALPSDQSNTIQLDVYQAFFNAQSQISIPVGGHYGDGSLLSQTFVARQPLVATLRSDPASPSRLPDRQCPSICAPDLLTTPHLAFPHVWHAQIYAEQFWQFTAGDGSFVGQVEETTVPVAIPFDLTYDAAHLTWIMTPLNLTNEFSSALCLDGRAYAANYFFVPSSSLTNYDPNPTMIDQGLQGCEILYTDHIGHTLTFLWRTGLLFAVDNATHLAEPYLPIATMADLQAYHSSG
jgi:hypothetical protein